MRRRSSRAPTMVSSYRDRRIARRLVVGAVAATLSLGGTSRAAQAEPVPLELQVDLLKKVVRFERGFAARSGPEVQLLLLVRAGDARSERAAAQLDPALRAMHDIAGKPVVVVIRRYSTATALREAVVAGGVDLVSARPRISINLGQARKQRLDFNSDLFRLARVIR